ncbi:hypothetical protein H257_11976 [Aphanomyces astaci]|uniref:Uncharacterized protein n=1 Tax=Aphanomyces astaci TaxID=112090 RepID=W4G2K3_APHAT|nr:hypothetical protein H257_11976 [Aphanomyces astaci]ETV73158.1 hypothetical protein H257_11976 [Aphanomyces astaci]|eukprot:XP_009837363.1 hypothetical protein H257_11976 [Aphanomyces astaci]
MLERVHQKQIHKHVLGTWLEESYASGKPRSINDAIRYCSLHIDGFTDKKIRSQRAWVSRAIRSLDLDEYISRSKPATSGAAKKPKMVLLSPSPTSLEDIEREVSEILAQMHDEAMLSSSTDSWCQPSLLPTSPQYVDSTGTATWPRPPLPPLYSPPRTASSALSTNSERHHFNPYYARNIREGDDPTSRW